ncbi:MAG: SH3 domain-containing protein [Desulfobulbaceae bacterium]|nr:SH3 domain-containing protein [Desulfobulbaceae bacterium]
MMFKKIMFGAIFLVLLTGVSVPAATMVSVAADKIKMHAAAGEKSPVLWILGIGYPLTVLDDQDDWLKVQDFAGDIGWVAAKLTNRQPHTIVKADLVDIRSGPSKRFKLVGRANKGVVFQTLKVKTSWIKVKHQNGLTGWIARSQLWGW